MRVVLVMVLLLAAAALLPSTGRAQEVTETRLQAIEAASRGGSSCGEPELLAAIALYRDAPAGTVLRARLAAFIQDGAFFAQACRGEIGMGGRVDSSGAHTPSAEEIRASARPLLDHARGKSICAEQVHDVTELLASLEGRTGSALVALTSLAATRGRAPRSLRARARAACGGGPRPHRARRATPERRRAPRAARRGGIGHPRSLPCRARRHAPAARTRRARAGARHRRPSPDVGSSVRLASRGRCSSGSFAASSASCCPAWTKAPWCGSRSSSRPDGRAAVRLSARAARRARAPTRSRRRARRSRGSRRPSPRS
jgi:hypothetical protein